MDLIEVVDLGMALFLMEYKEMLETATLQGAAIAGSERCCIIIKNKKGELVIKAGFPKNGHGIGDVIDIAKGEKLMRKIMNDGGIVWVDRPVQDDRTQYLRPIAEQYNIAAIMFIPLFCNNESLGLMAFDFTADRENNLRDNFGKIKKFTEIVATAMKVLYRQKKSNEKILRHDRLSLIGQNAAGIVHSIRNATTAIGLAANRLNKNIMDDGLKKYTSIINDRSDRIIKVVGDILRFSRFSPEEINIIPYNINTFLVEMAREFSRVYNLKINFHSDFDEKISLSFDRDLLEDCVHDLVRNAKESGAESVGICLMLEEDIARIIISNDGEPIPDAVIGQIFDPFITTKSRGTGLGLANVKMIVSAHGGDIKVESGEEETKFSILLPL